MVSAQTGNVFDSFTLTKPLGWQFNATAKAALVSGFISTYQETLGQRYGYSGASAAATAILTVVYNNPQLFTGLANATLVQDINVLDTLANTLQVRRDHTLSTAEVLTTYCHKNLFLGENLYQAVSCCEAMCWRRVVSSIACNFK